MNAMDHVRHLVETIGPRGSTTVEEKKASVYGGEQLEGMGLRPKMETFCSARSAWLPAALFWSLVLVSGFLFLGGGRIRIVTSLILSIGGLVSMLLEVSLRSNPLRWVLPKGQSQNVWTRIEAEEDAHEHVALVAHLDTHRTPLAFSSDRWVRWFEKLVPIGIAFAGLLIVTFALGIVWPVSWLRIVAIGPMLVAFGMLLLTLQADFTAYSPGANDNASGVGVVLSLAGKLAGDPLKHTAVWIVLTGCEEVGCYGAEDFIRRHRAELGQGAWISVDTVGSSEGAPVFLSQETFLATAKSDPELLDVARNVSARCPDLGAHEITMKGAYTDGAIGAKHGLRVLTFESHQTSGTLSDWHRPTDTVENVSAECMQATEAFLSEFLRELDLNAAAPEGLA
ncbi:M28 family peptidase [Candidatus Bipolaricaulota bacterium]